MYRNCSGYFCTEAWLFPTGIHQLHRTESATEQRLPQNDTGRVRKAGGWAGINTCTPMVGNMKLWVTEGFQKPGFISCLMTGCFSQLPLSAILFYDMVHLPHISKTSPCNIKVLPNGLLGAWACCRPRRKYCKIPGVGKPAILPMQPLVMVGKGASICIPEQEWSPPQYGRNKRVYILLQLYIYIEFSCKGHWLQDVFW